MNAENRFRGETPAPIAIAQVAGTLSRLNAPTSRTNLAVVLMFLRKMVCKA
jgi:hypothetical protein